MDQKRFKCPILPDWIQCNLKSLYCRGIDRSSPKHSSTKYKQFWERSPDYAGLESHCILFPKVIENKTVKIFSAWEEDGQHEPHRTQSFAHFLGDLRGHNSPVHFMSVSELLGRRKERIWSLGTWRRQENRPSDNHKSRRMWIMECGCMEIKSPENAVLKQIHPPP